MTRYTIAWPLFLLFAALPLDAGLAQSKPATAPVAHLALKGYDPVAYFTQGKPTRGMPKYETVFDGSRYRFSSQEHLTRFKANPDKYAPQFAGVCTAGLAMGQKIEANPLLWRIVDGKLYVFSRMPAQMKSNPTRVIGAARKNWEKLRGKPYN